MEGAVAREARLSSSQRRLMQRRATQAVGAPDSLRKTGLVEFVLSSPRFCALSSSGCGYHGFLDVSQGSNCNAVLDMVGPVLERTGVRVAVFRIGSHSFDHPMNPNMEVDRFVLELIRRHPSLGVFCEVMCGQLSDSELMLSSAWQSLNLVGSEIVTNPAGDRSLGM